MSEWDDVAKELTENTKRVSIGIGIPMIRAAALLRRAGRLEAKLQRVRDALKSMANSEGGLVDEIDAALAPEGGGK